MNKNKSLIFRILIISILIKIISTDDTITTIELDKIITGSLTKDNSYEFYQLKIPSDVKEGKLLVFTVKESQKGIAEGDEIFSDPDIHVSKINKYPKGKEEAQWYSQRYGNDILTIPGDEVKPGETFYIAMYCEFKCRYELNSYLADEVEIEIGKINSITLTKKNSLNYVINMPSENYKEFNLVATSPNLSSFKIFMSNESPSSENTFKIIPSWTGGYMISVQRDSEYYCIQCKYHILVQSQEEKEITVQLYAYFQDTITSLSSGSVVYDAIKVDQKRCYSFDTKKFNMNKEKILIQTTLFSGSALLYVSGEKKDVDKKYNDVLQESYSYQIQGEKIIMLEKSDIDKINQDYSFSNNEKTGLLHFCLYAKQMASFILNVYSLSDVSTLQKYNYISPGTELTGYLGGDRITRYRVLDFNRNKNSNITITFTNIKGKTEFYANFCSEKCNFNELTLNSKMSAGEMLEPTETSYSTYNLMITPDKNKCYQSNEKDDKCKILLVMKCSENENDYCSYKILASFSEQPTIMSPKKTYYNIIPKGKIDYYEIIVDDVTIPSIVVVLTTVTGNAELSVYRKNTISSFGIDSDNLKLIEVSLNKDYIPDVVRITPSKINGNNISGRYLIKVTSECFSSYNLYYYTTRNKAIEKELSINDITASLSEGQIIKDFFPNDIDYKIYIYTPDNNDQKDIKFVLTRINVGFAFKIFNDFKKIKILNFIKDDFEEKIQGYLWASDENNEVTISKDDKNYSSKKSYYIVVYKNRETIKDEEENKNLNKRSMMMYYIGVTKLGTPFTLYEIIEHSETLSNTYFYQNYWYVHNDITENFQLDVNILSGEVDILISPTPILIENITLNNNDITNLPDSIVKKIGVNNYASMALNQIYFHNYCSSQKNQRINAIINEPLKTCNLYIYIIQSKSSTKYSKDSQYILAAKSSSKTGKILLSGQVITGEVYPNKTEHYFIEEVKHRKGSVINVKFSEGSGDIYVRIPKKIEVGKNIVYPDEKNYDYKGQNSYMGQVVTLPSKIFDRIDHSSLKLQILISIVGHSYSWMNSKPIKFSISYSSEPKRINQNTPYTNYISAGEYQFYTLYFNKNIKNIYIALSNMNGDADLYLNYGLDKLPSPSEHDWYSVNMGHEYIDINEEDKFFVEKKLKNLAGYYSLLVVGFTETTYTLFVSSHDDNIFPLNDNSPISCRCESKGDKCLYRYDNIFRARGEEKDLYKNNEIIFTTQYIYGNGKMYANVYKDQDITSDRRKKYQDFFPNEKVYHFSNAEYGKRNYMKVKINEQQYSKDSLVLMTFICEEKTDVEITAASLVYQTIYNYLDRDRENIFYLKYNNSGSHEQQTESLFNFYSYKDEDIIYEIKAYSGVARIKIFTNETIYNRTTGRIRYDYNHISEFVIRSADSQSYQNSKEFTDLYINSIHKSMAKGKRIYFSVKPFTDFGFYLQILYDREWVNVPINKDKTYLVTNNQMYGYFDIYSYFQNVEMSISLDDFTHKTATIYIKLIVIEKDSKHIYSGNREDRLYHYEIPSKSNHDYTAKTNNYLGTMNININNIPIIKNEDVDKKFVRALFGIEIQKSYPVYTGDNNIDSQRNRNYNKKETNLRILVSPGVNNFKRVDVAPYNYYFSQVSLIPQRPVMNPNENTFYNGNKEIKIYSLDKINEIDDKMIIEISSCSGNYEVKLSKKIVNYDDNSNDLEYETYNGLQGKKAYILNNLRHKHVYLSVKSAQNEQECMYGNERDRNNNTCARELSYLLFYYSTASHRQYTDNNIYRLSFRLDTRAQFYIIVPQIKNIDKKYLEYSVIWTFNKNISENMGSICFLSQVLNNETNTSEIYVEKNAKIDYINQIHVKKLHLSTQTLYFNVLVRNSLNNELITFELGVVRMNKTWATFVIIVFIIGILGFFYYFFYNDIKRKAMDCYVNGFNFGITNKNDSIKYTNLSDNYY